MQVQTPEVSAEKATTPTFKSGDKGTFTQIRRGAKTGHLQEQDGAHLPQGHKLFHFHTSDEINP